MKTAATSVIIYFNLLRKQNRTQAKVTRSLETIYTWKQQHLEFGDQVSRLVLSSFFGNIVTLGPTIIKSNGLF